MIDDEYAEISLRIPATLYAALEAKAQETQRSVDSLVWQGIERVVAQNPKLNSKPKLKFSEVARAFAGTGRKGDGLNEKGMAQRMRLVRGDG